LTDNRFGITIESVCENIHKDFAKDFKYALVWGRIAKFSPQTCGLAHQLIDEDVIQIFVSTNKKFAQPKPMTADEKAAIQKAKAKVIQAKKDKKKK